MTTRVLVVDDQALLRTAFTSLIDAEEDLEVVGEALDGRDAVEQSTRLLPDVVVMDVRMPVMDGIEATRRLAIFPVGERLREDGLILRWASKVTLRVSNPKVEGQVVETKGELNPARGGVIRRPMSGR